MTTIYWENERDNNPVIEWKIDEILWIVDMYSNIDDCYQELRTELLNHALKPKS